MTPKPDFSRLLTSDSPCARSHDGAVGCTSTAAAAARRIFAPLTALALVVPLHWLRAADMPSEDNLPPAAETEIWSPVPRVVHAEPGAIPSDAVVLFDGHGLEAWESAKTPGQPALWKIEEGAMIVSPKSGDIRTKQAFGDVQLHLEWRTPAVVTGSSQGRGNSGIYFMGLYELQVLDSYDNPTYVNGQAGAIYKQHIPLVNASRKPGEWQTYDVVWQAPRFSADGKLRQPAHMTVLHNGVLVQYHAELTGPTTHRGVLPYTAHAAKLPIVLQDHGNPIGYRNVWVRELDLK